MDKQRFSRTLGGGTKDKPISHWGPGAPRFRTKGFWKDAVKWNNQAGQVEIDHNDEINLGKDLGNYVRPRIFPSLCDWLDEEVPIEWLADFLKLIHDTPNLDWLLLTKRPENFLLQTGTVALSYADSHNDEGFLEWVTSWTNGEKAPNNVWIGASVEDKARKTRIDELRRIPAKVRFLSLEPLLEDLGQLDLRGIDWVIVGGESGPGARPCNVEWIRDIVRQCEAAGTPCFVKQLGSLPYEEAFPHQVTESEERAFKAAGWCHMVDFPNRPPSFWKKSYHLKDKKGGDMSEWPEDLRVRQFPTLSPPQPIPARAQPTETR